MKNILITIATIISIPAIAQIGINTENPQTLFHVDARYTTATTNPATGVPTAMQQQDDVVITKDGRMGIGTISPQVKLEINTQNVSGVYPLQIVDTTDPTDKILISDANGNAFWEAPQPPVGQVYPMQDITTATLSPQGVDILVPNSSFTIPHDGFYSFEVRWWSFYTASYSSIGRISIVLKLKINGSTTVDSYRYQSPFLNRSITSYIPLYTKAKKNDVLSLYIESIEAPGDVQVAQAQQWTTSRILIKELQVKF